MAAAMLLVGFQQCFHGFADAHAFDSDEPREKRPILRVQKNLPTGGLGSAHAAAFVVFHCVQHHLLAHARE